MAEPSNTGPSGDAGSSHAPRNQNKSKTRIRSRMTQLSAAASKSDPGTSRNEDDGNHAGSSNVTEITAQRSRPRYARKHNMRRGHPRDRAARHNEPDSFDSQTQRDFHGGGGGDFPIERIEDEGEYSGSQNAPKSRGRREGNESSYLELEEENDYGPESSENISRLTDHAMTASAASSSHQHVNLPVPGLAHDFVRSHLAWNRRGEAVHELGTLGALVNPQGFITVRLRGDIRVDLTENRAIRVQNNPGNVIMALNAAGSSSSMIHPTGRVYQYGSRVEVNTLGYGQRGDFKLAKMSRKGVSFTSDKCALIYLVDSGGVRTTTDTFSDLSGDISAPVFVEDSHMGPQMLDVCMESLCNSRFWIIDGNENWIINGVRISQAPDGLVRISRDQGKHFLRTSPITGNAVIQSPFLHATASHGHLFVKRGERRLHYDGNSFIIRDSGHSAGFDARNKLKVF